MSSEAIYIAPARPRLRIKPFKAMSHMRQLIADKEDTKHVFYILQALNGDAVSYTHLTLPTTPYV